MKNRISEIALHLLDSNFNFDGTVKFLQQAKDEYKQAGDEDNANWSWAGIQLVEIFKKYRETFHLLKTGEYYKAWCLLEQIEIENKFLVDNFPSFSILTKNIIIIVKQLQGLYPYKWFFSTVLLIKERKCSICNKKRSLRSNCEHIKGTVYHGELCADKITDCQLLSVDLVNNPEHKYAVPFTTSDKGEKIDHYDYKLLIYLMSIWHDPFELWYYDVKTDYLSHNNFSNLSDDSLCPCSSGKLYKNCCKNDDKGIKHYTYIFHYRNKN